ncbi:MAG: cell filamentation protein Fic [Alcaligenaceae bacterium]|nr:cell filamentation protein Fic [Alcaligenaceae bacterium SAGV5]MPS50419.1 cell filamentation protein Fic [Alcaligenaceae bacterium SAGV3]MPT57920.1 cell filamentation protein Fic [Alcaligenaceae bacterium]
MIVFELTNTEDHPIYRELEASNGSRQYDFLRSMVLAAVQAQQVWLSQQIIKALNYQAIACLHTNPGEFRPCPVRVGSYLPPEHFRVQAQMDSFVNLVNSQWATTDAVALASLVLWRLNHIHPFINGNGRTARAACYFVLCVKAGGWLPGNRILPELLRENRDEYVEALRAADASLATGPLDLTLLHRMIERLLAQQLAEAGVLVPPAAAPPKQ